MKRFLRYLKDALRVATVYFIIIPKLIYVAIDFLPQVREELFAFFFHMPYNSTLFTVMVLVDLAITVLLIFIWNKVLKKK